MDMTHLFGLLGGLALFLYGMQMMSDGLEDAAGNKMEKILERLTANRILGVVVGAVITAVIQSSSATTVMVVGFVNSGMMTLQQAVWIIMGANIGTTITGQLIALDVGELAPLIAFIGVVMVVFLKVPRLKHIGNILAGLGVLFIGMDMMGNAMDPLQESKAFVSLMTKFSNPVLGILAGAVFTAIIQSSSASVGILQTLLNKGLIAFPNAVYVLFGQNIGTCITAVLASIGTNRSAKRTTIIHLSFNLIGTAIFTILCLVFPVAKYIGDLTPNNPAAQIANMHTTFNVVTTLILLPFGTYLAKLATIIMPETEEEKKGISILATLKEEFGRGRTSLGAGAIHMDILRQELERMIGLSAENLERCYSAVINADDKALEQIRSTEKEIDVLNKDISQYISKILVHNNSGQNVADIEQFFLITGNAERIGDHALNIGEYVEVIQQKAIKFSEGAKAELIEMQQISKKAIEKVLSKQADTDTTKWLVEIAALEQKIDDMTQTYRDQHLERMRSGKCTEEACVLYSELLTDFERIGDHILNIAQAYSKMELIDAV